ncbi:MAG: Gfo/Idh/MocA family oxidoreductase [Clostridiales bacterium]|jgi:predicted dehydrogenase|nr:Gfo/Idh/MocA family oxidoreductase [Clostridiales bacterium]
MMIANVAIVGYGGMGKGHADRLRNNPKFELAGIYDTDPRRQAAGGRDGLHIFGLPGHILDRGAHGVIIAVPNDFHRFYVEYFCKADVCVLCEKPVMMSSKELKTVLKNIGDDKKRFFAVNQNRRFDPDYLTVKKIIENNSLGGVYRIESRVTGGNGIPGDWRKLKAKGGGMMLDWGVHLIDQLVMMFPGSVIKRIDCRYSYIAGCEVEDGFFADLYFNNGVEARVVVDTNTFIPAPRWRVFGCDGTAEISTWDLDGKIVRPFPSDGVERPAMTAGNGLTRTMAYKHSDEVETLPLPAVEPLGDAIYENFYEMIMRDVPPLVKSDETMRVLKIMEAAKLSADAKKPVTGSF